MGLLLIVRAFSVILAYVYPAYASYKALESNGPEGPSQWLTYWIVLGLFNVLEFVVHWALKWYGIIYWIKLGFVLWLQLPQFKGAQFLYVKFIHPQLKRHEEKIDVVLDQGVQRASSNLHKLQERWPNLFNRTPSVADRMLEELEEADTGPKGDL
ncbi:unnamed protein product [Calypogeia fissa]